MLYIEPLGVYVIFCKPGSETVSHQLRTSPHVTGWHRTLVREIHTNITQRSIKVNHICLWIAYDTFNCTSQLYGRYCLLALVIGRPFRSITGVQGHKRHLLSLPLFGELLNTYCCDRNNDSKKRCETKATKTHTTSLALKNHQLAAFLPLYLHYQHENTVKWRWCLAFLFEVGFKTSVFSLHCVQKLIYGSWPWLLFCVTAINVRKVRNRRGTESAVFHFFCSYSTAIFPPWVNYV